tara:strand:- start:238 stop:372 length:135 start_codon:yes stop_codon:yes gene_type:complete
MKNKGKIQERLNNELQRELDQETKLKKLRRLKALQLENGTLHWR